METLTEQGPSYERVEVTSDFYNLPNPYDQAPESNQEKGPSVSELQYIEGPDGFYVCDPETGEAVLSMPLIISDEQQDTLKTVLTDGIASIDVPTDFGTDDEEVWSLQTFSLSGETPDGRRIITLRAVMERRPKCPEEEPQGQADAFDAAEQAVAVTDARAAVEAAILNQEVLQAPRPTPALTTEPADISYPIEKVEKTPAAAEIEQTSVTAEVALAPVSQLQAQPKVMPGLKNSQKAVPHEVVPVFEEPTVTTTPAIQPPIVIRPEQSEVLRFIPDNPVRVETIAETPAEEVTESQPNSIPIAEAALPVTEPLAEPEDEATAADEPAQFELPPVKQEPAKLPAATKKAKPHTFPPVQKIFAITAKARLLVTPTPVVKVKKVVAAPAATHLAHPTRKQSPARSPEARVELKKVVKTAPQETPIVVRETAKPTTVKQIAPAHEMVATAPVTPKEVVQQTDEELYYVQNQPKHAAEHVLRPRVVAPHEAPTPLQITTSNERLNSPDWEQERSAQRLASVFASQSGVAADAEDIVVSFVVSNPSKRTPRARATRSIAA